MNPVDIIAIAVIALIIGGAVAYIIRAKKSGKGCIGCPYSGSCSKCNRTKGGCSGAPRDKGGNNTGEDK